MSEAPGFVFDDAVLQPSGHQAATPTASLLREPGAAAAPVPSWAAARRQPARATADTAAGQADGKEEALYTLAEEYRQLGDAERAEQLFHRLFREGRHRERAALALGDLYLASERFGEARDMFELLKELYDEADLDYAARVSGTQR